MSLQFIVGPSGCGKSHYIYNKIIEESVLHSEKMFYVIVPEQFSLETQRTLSALHPSNCLLNIDILSFNRLAYRVLEKTGREGFPALDDTGKIFVLRKILNDRKDELKVMRGLLNKSGAASELNSLLSELTQYRVDTDEIDTTDKNISGLLKAKLEDVSLIKNGFFKYISGKYLVMEEVPEALSRVIESYEPLKDSVVVFDGFTGFVPTQLLVIQKMLKLCDRVIVTAAADENESISKKCRQSDLFCLSHEMADGLIKAAEDAKVPVLKNVFLKRSKDSRLGKNEELSFLENHLFRYSPEKFEKTQGSIFIGAASNAFCEIEAAAETISKLVRTKGYRYRDFAFVSGDIDSYGEKAKSIFESNNIPCFLDKKQSVTGNPAVEFVRAAAEMASENFSYKSVFRLLKTGFTSFSEDEINILENYVLAARINSLSKYKQPWERTFPSIDSQELVLINAVREKFVFCVEEFADSFRKRGASVMQRTRALYKLIADNSLQEKCKAFEERFKASGDLAMAAEYSQVYRAIMDLLDKLVEILSDEKVSLELYRQLLDSAFEDIKIGIAPLNQDQVLIGDIERSRLSNIKVMFFAGLNEGIVPKAVSPASSLIAQQERESLSNMGIRLSPDIRERMYSQRLYLYLNLTKPSERLYLSYSASDSAGSGLVPSYLIKTIKDMFPLITVADLDNREEFLKAETIRGRDGIITDGYKRLYDSCVSDSFLEIVSRYMADEETRSAIEKLNEAVNIKLPETNIDKEDAEQLYGINKPYSASRIETFCGCRFSHFLKYALGLKERDIFEFTPADIGSILHKAAKLFCEDMYLRSWAGMAASDINAAADAAFKTAYEENYTSSGSIREFDYVRLGHINRRNAQMIAQQVKNGSFIPSAFEQKFMFEGTHGIIDRVDVCDYNGSKYIRIIDYKSSAKDVDLTGFIYGTQIQLPLYMTAAMENERIKNKNMPVNAAGLYYYTMDYPVKEVSSLDEIVSPVDFLSELKLNGLSVNDAEVLRLMDSSLIPGTASSIIPVRINKPKTKDAKPEFSKQSRIISQEDFYNIERYTRLCVKSVRKLIEGGRAEIDPKQTPQSDSCKYCPYLGICRFDERIPGYKKSKFEKTDDETAMKRILSILEKEGKNNV